MPIDQHSMSQNEENCTRMFRAETTNDPENRKRLTGFYWKRRFRSDLLQIVTQVWNEAYEGEEVGLDHEADWDHFAFELATLKVSNEEDAQARFQKYFHFYDKDPNVIEGEFKWRDNLQDIDWVAWWHQDGRLEVFAGDNLFQTVHEIELQYADQEFATIVGASMDEISADFDVFNPTED